MKIKTDDFRVKCGCRSVGECNHNIFAEAKALRALSNRIADEMKIKLINKYMEGYTGWDNEEDYPIEILKEHFQKHIKKGFEESNMIDIINLAAMIWNRL